MIEKHFTLSRNIKTPDSFFSTEPQELKKLIQSIRMTEKAMGRIYYGLTEGEKKSRVFRRSLFAVEDIKKGERFTPENVRSIRPGNGMAPKFYRSVLGKRAARDIKRATPLRHSLVGS